MVFFFGTVDLEYKQGKIAPQRLSETFSTILRPPKQDRRVPIIGREPETPIEYHFETRGATRPLYPAPRRVKDRKIPVMDPETLPIPPPEPQRPPPPVPEWKNYDQAYVMLLTNDKPMHLAWALEGALRNVSSTRRRIALVTSDVSIPMRDVLQKLQMEVQVIPKLAHPNFKTAYTRWKDSLTKFAVFSLKNITKFVYLDTDLMINDNIDDFFDLDTNGLVHGMLDRPGCNNTSPWLNAGLLISSPNETLKYAMISSLNDTDNPTRGGGGDQEILNRYLSKHGMMRTRPEHDMAFLWRCSCVQEKKVDPYDWASTRIIHYTGWYMDVPALVRDGIQSRSWEPLCAMPWYYRWVDVHRDLRIWWEQHYGKMPSLPIVKL